MKLLVVSEGKHELNLDGETGALVELIRPLMPTGFEYERRKVSDKAVQQVAMRGKAGKHEKRLLMWVRYAERHGFDALVLVIDEDGDKDRRIAVANVQAHSAFALPRAIGLAIRSFDAWMLADEVALSRVLQRTIQRQSEPERHADPKSLCRTLADAGEVKIGLTELYTELATVIDLDRLASRCASGFAPFRDQCDN